MENITTKTKNNDIEENLTKIEDIKSTTGKRINFDKQTLMRLETMIPLYRDEFGENLSSKDELAAILKKATDCLFENDFKVKIASI